MGGWVVDGLMDDGWMNGGWMDGWMIDDGWIMDGWMAEIGLNEWSVLGTENKKMKRCLRHCLCFQDVAFSPPEEEENPTRASLYVNRPFSFLKAQHE